MKHRRFTFLGSCLLLLMIAFSPAAFPQSQDERAVRAAYVFNIMKLMEWPSDKNRLVVGFLGDRETGELFHNLLDGKNTGSRSIYFMMFPSEAELRSCSVVYVAGAQNSKNRATLTSLENLPILTIGESDSFARDGGMISLTRVGTQIRMQVNPEAARRAGINLSPRLLALAEIVHPNTPPFDRGERRAVQRSIPEYPALAESLSLHGTVKLKVYIAPDGAVRRAECIGGHPLLAQAALKAVVTWKFERAPKETTQMIDIDF